MRLEQINDNDDYEGLETKDYFGQKWRIAYCVCHTSWISVEIPMEHLGNVDNYVIHAEYDSPISFDEDVDTTIEECPANILKVLYQSTLKNEENDPDSIKILKAMEPRGLAYALRHFYGNKAQEEYLETQDE